MGGCRSRIDRQNWRNCSSGQTVLRLPSSVHRPPSPARLTITPIVTLIELTEQFIEGFGRLYAPLSIDEVVKLDRNTLVRVRHQKRTVWVCLVPIVQGVPYEVARATGDEALGRYEREIELKRPDLAHRKYHLTLLVEVLGAAAAEKIRAEENLGYFDLTGNAYIDAPGLFIRTTATTRQNIKALKMPPITARTEFVMRALVCHSNRIWSLEELAKESTVSKSWVSTVMQSFGAMQWVHMTKRSRRGYTVMSKERLLDQWLKDYKHFLASTYYLRSPLNIDEPAKTERALHDALVALKAPHAFTSFSAASRFGLISRYNEVNLYADVTREQVRGLAGTLKMEFARYGNVRIMRPRDGRYYYRGETRGELPLVHPVQAYLDTAINPIRGEEIARQFREAHLNLDDDHGG